MTFNRSLLAFLFFPILAQAQISPTDSLTEEEFKAAGLHKLTAEELATLNALISRTEATGVKSAKVDPEEEAPPSEVAPQAAKQPDEATIAKQQEDLYGKEQLAIDTRKAPKKIESRLVGTFNGWFGSTRFELENGQVWIQRIKDVQKYRATENPKVTVFKSIGGYRIRIEGYRQTCAVKRIK